MLTPASPHPPLHPTFDRWYAGARLINAVLGAWLFTSVFVWQHLGASSHNTWLTGVLIFGSALNALRRDAWRWANTALSGWLFASTLLIFRPIDIKTLWNNGLVAVVVFVMSLVARGGHSQPRLRAIAGGRRAWSPANGAPPQTDAPRRPHDSVGSQPTRNARGLIDTPASGA